MEEIRAPKSKQKNAETYSKKLPLMYLIKYATLKKKIVWTSKGWIIQPPLFSCCKYRIYKAASVRVYELVYVHIYWMAIVQNLQRSLMEKCFYMCEDWVKIWQHAPFLCQRALFSSGRLAAGTRTWERFPSHEGAIISSVNHVGV